MQNEPGQPVRLSRAQVREIDRRAIEECHVPGIVLMENAARAVVDAATDMLRGVKDPAVMVLCGGILCLLGEGVSLDYVGHAAKDAAAQHACMRVNILSDADKWKLVSITTSNQSPYCTD